MIYTDNFKWLYVGNGSIAGQTAASIKKGNHTVSAVFGRNAEKVKAFAGKHSAKAFTDFDKALSEADFDAVYIATPHTSHFEYAKKALEKGKPVLCEKPVTVSERDAKILVDTAKANGVYFCEAMWTWFSPVAQKVKSWVDGKAVGDITDVTIDYFFPGLMLSKNSRVRKPSTAGGALLDVGIYPITYCYVLFGFPEKIECSGTIKDGIDIKETVILYYDSFKCTLNIGLDKLKEGCVINGTKGSINLPMFHMAWKAVLKTDKKTVFRGRTDYLTEFTCVANEIKAGKTESDIIPFVQTLNVLKILDESRRQLGLVYPFEKI